METGSSWGRRFRRRAAAGPLLVALALAAGAGCGGGGDKYPREPISGTVTVDGQPLKGGYLVFEPKGGQPTQSGGMIYDGKFDVPAMHGAVPGLYSVAIFAEGEATPTTAQPGTPEYELATARAPKNKIPVKYNIKSELTADVKAGEANVYTFELSTK